MNFELKKQLDVMSDLDLMEMGYARIERPTKPPKLKIIPEVAAAAQWWTDVLRKQQPMDNGDVIQSAFASFAASTLPPLRDDQLESFRGWLAALVQFKYVDQPDAWRPSQPQWGSACRTLSVDYHPDLILSAAADAAGFSTARGPNRFPIKTTMWISPGEVKFQQGWGGSEVVLYPPRE